MFTDIVIKNDTNKLLFFYGTFCAANLLCLNFMRSKKGLHEYCRNNIHKLNYKELILVLHEHMPAILKPKMILY
jgi:hypothetical protein